MNKSLSRHLLVIISLPMGVGVLWSLLVAECNRLDSVISDPVAGKGGFDKVASDAAGATAGENLQT